MADNDREMLQILKETRDFNRKLLKHLVPQEQSHQGAKDYNINQIPLDSAVTNQLIQFSPTSRIQMLDWPDNMTTFDIRFEDLQNEAFSILNDASTYVLKNPVQRIFITTAPALAGGIAKMLLGRLEVKAGKARNFFGSQPGGNASNPLFVTEHDTATAVSHAEVTVGVATTAVLAANANRKRYFIQNIGAARITLNLGAAAVLGNGIILEPASGVAIGDGGTWGPDDMYTGVINGIGDVAGEVEVLEYI